MSEPLMDLGEDLEIRLLDPDDAQEIFEIVEEDRERLRPWMPWVDPTKGPDDVRAFIEGSRAADSLDALGIFLSGAFVGGIGLRVDDFSVDGEIGYWIGSAHEGEGLVTRACRALIELAFDDLELHRATICVASSNARSRAIPERLGFTEEGLMREAGLTSTGYHDLVVYGLLAHERPLS